MCGILGSINLLFNKEILDLIIHRGPDGYGLDSFEYANNLITLGHRRLSIVDLSETGHQPMTSQCGNFTIIFNGEIYNHQDLRKRLSDIDFKGHSDTETIVNYISKFGIDSIKDFNGIFAFGILDRKNNKLHIARDRYGVKPVYYYHKDNQIAFSSELKPIKKLVNTNLDMDSLSLVLRLRYTPSPYTLLKDIFKVRPGHIITFDLNNYSHVEKSFIEPIKINNNILFDEALKQYGNYFEDAVKRQLMSDVDIGILLSGGIDSALVTYFADKHYGKKMKTFTVGFKENDDANELIEAKQTSDIIGTDHYEVLIDSDQFDNAFKSLVKTIEEPLGTTSSIPLYYLCELVSKHVKVVLTGQGADEPLGGYPRYKGELYKEYLPNNFFNMFEPYEKMFRKKEKISRAFYSLGETDIIKRFDKTYALFTSDEVETLTNNTNNRSLETISYYYNLLEGYKKDPVEAMMSVDSRMNLSDDLLLLSDKISMNFSVEGRVPMLDNNLVDFVESLPSQYRLNLKEGKIIHKKFAESVLPQEVIYRKKKGFKTPTDKWFRESIGSKYYELLSSKNTKFSNYVDTEKVKDIFEQHLEKGINREKQIFSLISIYYWLEEFL